MPGARRALLDSAAGAVWMPDGRLRVAAFTVGGERMTTIDLIADPERLRESTSSSPRRDSSSRNGPKMQVPA
jgi:hypothetical protein